MKKPQNPCNIKEKDCPERAPDYHGRYASWAEYEKANEAYNAAIRYEKNKDYGPK